MMRSPKILGMVLLVFAIFVAGYVNHVQGTMRTRIEKVASRMDELTRLQQSVEGYQAVLKSWEDVPSTPLPDVRQEVRDAGLSSTLTVKEENLLTLSPEWTQRRIYLSVKPMAVENLDAWLSGIRTDVGWRVIAVDVKAGATPGMIQGEIVLAGLERTR